MSGNLGQYTLLFVTVNGALLAEEQSVQIDRATNAQPVNTVPGGYSGDSPGAGMTEFTVVSAIPAPGQEYDAGPQMAALSVAQVYVLGAGGKTLKGECMIYADSMRHGTGTAAEYTFRARSKLSLWQ